MHDPKQGEREYYARLGPEGLRHSARKPFGDDACARYLSQLAAIFGLLRPPPAHLVEFGCGTGWLSLLLAERGYEVTGVDISPEAVTLATSLARERGLPRARFLAADYESVCVEPRADYVLFHDALHHAEDEHAAMRAAYAALLPGGMLLAIEPGDGHSTSPESRHAVATFGVHEKEMPPRRIVALGRAAGFRRHAVLPWPWDYMRAVYRPAYAHARSPAELRSRRWLSWLRSVRSLFKTRAQGVVVLLKD